MTEKYVIGAFYTVDGMPFRFFVQGDYFEAYAKELAYNLRMIKNDGNDQEKGQFLANLIDLLLSDADPARVLPTLPESDHTVHLVNIDEGTVELWDNKTMEMKVSFSFDNFIKRYYK